MAHCPPELLDDLGSLFVTLKTWPGVIEKRTGVFYVGTQPFLHFHLLAGGRRRADVKGRARWVQLDLPRPATVARRRILVHHLRARYAEKRESARLRKGTPSRHTRRRSRDL